MILDDGGDATLLVHLGAQAEKDPACIAHPTNEEETALFDVDQGAARQGPDVLLARSRRRSRA